MVPMNTGLRICRVGAEGQKASEPRAFVRELYPLAQIDTILVEAMEDEFHADAQWWRAREREAKQAGLPGYWNEERSHPADLPRGLIDAYARAKASNVEEWVILQEEGAAAPMTEAFQTAMRSLHALDDGELMTHAAAWVESAVQAAVDEEWRVANRDDGVYGTDALRSLLPGRVADRLGISVDAATAAVAQRFAGEGDAATPEERVVRDASGAIAFSVASDLYLAGRTEDGEDFIASAYYVMAENARGDRWALETRFRGCRVSRDDEGWSCFADVREEAKAAADRVLDGLAGREVSLEHWRPMRPVYGSDAYSQYGQHEDWLAERAEAGL